jgi:hypothetical protein
MTYQNYGEAFRGARFISTQMPFGSFILFPAEIVRTQANMARLMVEDMQDPQLRKTVPLRAASMLASFAAADALAQIINRMVTGIDDEEEEAFRKTLPSYQENSTLLFLNKNDDGSWKFVDLGYVNPFNIISSSVRAGLRSGSPGEAAKAVVVEALKPLLSFQLALGKAVEAITGKTQWGGEVYNSEDSGPVKVLKGTGHMMTQQVPQDLYRIFSAFYRDAVQDVNRFGVYRTTTQQFAAEFTGYKATNKFPEQGMRTRARDFSGVVSNHKSSVKKLLQNRRLVDDDRIRKAYQAAVRNQRLAIDKFREDVIESARVLKVDEAVIIKELNDGGISKRDITTIMNGGYPPIKFTKNDVSDVLADMNKYPRDRGATVEDINRRLSILQEEQQRAVSR